MVYFIILEAVLSISSHTVGVKKKVPVYRPCNGTGNSVPFPFRSRLISVPLPF